MSQFERALLYAILLLAGFRLIGLVLDDGSGGVSPIDPPAHEPPAAAAPADGGTGSFTWDPAGFSRKGIPGKLTLGRDGRIPDGLSLTDTQRAYVYATMMLTYDGLLERAKADCDAVTQAAVLRWQARHAATISGAVTAMTALSGHAAPAGKQAYEALSRQAFQQKVCPTVRRHLSTGGYDPHPDAVTVLAHAKAQANRLR